MAFQRNPENVQPVVDGEVLVSFADDPKIGFDGTFNDDWETLGILNDGSRVELNRVVDKNKTSGWGYGVVAVDTRPGELTATAETLEDNEAVQRIAWPHRQAGEGAVVDGEASILYHDEEVAQPFVAMVEKQQTGRLRIRASRLPAIATMEDIGYGQEVTGRTVTFDFQTGRNKDAFDELVLNDAKVAAAEKDSLIRFGEAANGGTAETGEDSSDSSRGTAESGPDSEVPGA